MNGEYVTKSDLQAAVEQLQENIRDAQTEILRAFYNWARPMEARTKPIEEHAQRLAWLEDPVAELERRNLMDGR